MVLPLVQSSAARWRNVLLTRLRRATVEITTPDVRIFSETTTREGGIDGRVLEPGQCFGNRWDDYLR